MKYPIYALLILFSFFILFQVLSNQSSTKVIETGYTSSQNAVIQKEELSTAEMEGKALFEKNCNACHGIHKTDDFLLGFQQRGLWANRKELYKWIRNPKDYIAHDTTGYTIKLKQVYGISMMPFPQLSNSDIDKILDYLAKEDI